MFSILGNLKIIAFSALVAVTASVAAFYYGKSTQRSETRSEAALEALDRIHDMENNNASFSKLSNRDRCLAFMRDSGLPVDRCEQR